MLAVFLFWALREPSFPSKIDSDQIVRIEFVSGDDEYIPLFADRKEDKDKIEQLVRLYNESIPKLVQEALHSDPLMLSFAAEARLVQDNGDILYLNMGDGGVFRKNKYESVGECYYLKDETLHQKIADLIIAYAKPATGLTVKPQSSTIHMGDQLSLSTDYIAGKEASIELIPAHPKVLRMKWITVKTVPLVHGVMNDTITLSEQIGTTADGSSGKLCPGEWILIVRTSLTVLQYNFTILS